MESSNVLIILIHALENNETYKRHSVDQTQFVKHIYVYTHVCCCTVVREVVQWVQLDWFGLINPL